MQADRKSGAARRPVRENLCGVTRCDRREPWLLPDRGWRIREFAHFYHGKSLSNTAGNFSLRDILCAQAVGNVVKDAQVRKQRVALKHGVHGAAMWRNLVEAVASD